MSNTELPPLTELFSIQDFTNRHPTIFSKYRLQWALRNRAYNGLNTTNSVFETRSGELLIREPNFLAWYLGLAGKHKPRAGRWCRKAVQS